MRKFSLLLIGLCLTLLIACESKPSEEGVPSGLTTVSTLETAVTSVASVTSSSMSGTAAPSAPVTSLIATQDQAAVTSFAVTEGPTVTASAATTQGGSLAVPENDPRRDVVICLDAGHGLIDPGAIGKLSGVTYYEKTINLSLALNIEEKLISRGYQVVMVRRGDTSLLGGSSFSAKYSTVDEAVARRILGKKAGADLYLSIHCNSYGGEGRASGPIVFYQSSPKTSYKALSLAKLFSSFITSVNQKTETGRDCRIRAGDSYIVLKEMSMPSLLLEVGFMSDAEDLSLISSEAWQNAFADGILAAVEEAFSKGYIG